MATFAATMVGAILRGRAGAPCACFGARSTVGWGAVARNLVLAARLRRAAVAARRASSRPTSGSASGSVVALLACAGARGRRPRARPRGRDAAAAPRPAAALEIAEEGPPLVAASRLDRALRPRARSELGARRLRLRGLPRLPRRSSRRSRRSPTTRCVAVATFDEAATPRSGRELEIPGSPFAVALDLDGTVLAKGTFNNLAQLESVLATAERRRAERELAGGGRCLSPAAGRGRPGARLARRRHARGAASSPAPARR